MLCGYGRPVTEESETQVNLWVLIVTAIIPFQSVLFVTIGLEKHVKKRSDQDVEVHKIKWRYIWEKLSCSFNQS